MVVCAYLDNICCIGVKIQDKLCNKNIEYLLSLRPFYLACKFTKVCVIGVCIPLDADVKLSENIIHKVTCEAE